MFIECLNMYPWSSHVDKYQVVQVILKLHKMSALKNILRHDTHTILLQMYKSVLQVKLPAGHWLDGKVKSAFRSYYI